MTVIPPVLFFWSDSNHLKLLAYAPVLRRLVEPMGFQASSMMTSAVLQGAELDSPTRALVLLARWYKVWMLAGLVLVAAMTVRWIRHRPLGELLSNRGII